LILIPDPDAHIMQLANGEKNPACSVTTAADSKADIVAHFHVNAEDHDSDALQPALSGRVEKTGKAHEHTTADDGFGSTANLAYLKLPLISFPPAKFLTTTKALK
jgi:hypothetical protein